MGECQAAIEDCIAHNYEENKKPISLPNTNLLTIAWKVKMTYLQKRHRGKDTDESVTIDGENIPNKFTEVYEELYNKYHEIFLQSLPCEQVSSPGDISSDCKRQTTN